MSQPLLIGLDWGTTSCRAYLIGAEGAVLARVSDGPGILKVENGAFGATFDAMTRDWDRTLPVIMSGMIGSRQGWREAAYLKCPAGERLIATALATVDHAGRKIMIVPGFMTAYDTMPDVMRGEETQIFGALALTGQNDGLFLLPGTHSKWVEVSDGRIMTFRTFMTGEVFGALKDHTILGRLMRESETPHVGGFVLGVREGGAPGSPGALLNRIFATRTYRLMDRLPDTALADYLSGLLIGAEVAEAAGEAKRTVTIIASRTLAHRYFDALRLLGHEITVRPREGVPAGDDVTFAMEDCVAAGHWRIARSAGLC